jgi:hypothetical protein
VHHRRERVKEREKPVVPFSEVRTTGALAVRLLNPGVSVQEEEEYERWVTLPLLMSHMS